MLFLLCLESDAYLRLKNNVWMAKHLMKLVEFFVFFFNVFFYRLTLGVCWWESEATNDKLSSVLFVFGGLLPLFWWIFLLWQFLGGVIQSQHVVQALC